MSRIKHTLVTLALTTAVAGAAAAPAMADTHRPAPGAHSVASDTHRPIPADRSVAPDTHRPEAGGFVPLDTHRP
ncbi:hypothetical protein [Streptomyces sp. Ac-502]|uniref:hypothetical protein n=1 Tax=Streptomyces sp. Ac-502 TaxID=3342801 RepID=UPI0038624E89